MKLIKQKILLEDSIDRANDSPNWGSITASTFYINVFLTQNIDDMGLFADFSFLSADSTNTSVDYSILEAKLNSLGIVFPFMNGSVPSMMTGITQTDIDTLRFIDKSESDYYVYGNLNISGKTDSKIEDVKSYNGANKYIPNFDIGKETYLNYDNITIDGVNRVVSLGEPTIYAIDATNNGSIGTPNQYGGISYNDYTGITRNVVVDGVNKSIPTTTFNFKGEGRNMSNTSYSALTKEEYLFGIISTPEVKNEVFIDRSVQSVIEFHLRLSEINNLGHLSRYGNGLYRLRKE